MQTIIVIKVQQNMQRKYHREYVEYRIDNKYSHHYDKAVLVFLVQ